eukprot:GHVN01106646.1.p1 GENE.GHVN01106646.1~~GHVN01106646.1.p1  ORF type:complete len:1041 (+),score=274.96 GHVN01106646.1:417-3539(+)
MRPTDTFFDPLDPLTQMAHPTQRNSKQQPPHSGVAHSIGSVSPSAPPSPAMFAIPLTSPPSTAELLSEGSEVGETKAGGGQRGERGQRGDKRQKHEGDRNRKSVSSESSESRHSAHSGESDRSREASDFDDLGELDAELEWMDDVSGSPRLELHSHPSSHPSSQPHSRRDSGTAGSPQVREARVERGEIDARGDYTKSRPDSSHKRGYSHNILPHSIRPRGVSHLTSTLKHKTGKWVKTGMDGMGGERGGVVSSSSLRKYGRSGRYHKFDRGDEICSNDFENQVYGYGPKPDVFGAGGHPLDTGTKGKNTNHIRRNQSDPSFGEGGDGRVNNASLVFGGSGDEVSGERVRRLRVSEVHGKARRSQSSGYDRSSQGSEEISHRRRVSGDGGDPPNRRRFSPPPNTFTKWRRVHLVLFMTAFSVVTSILSIFYVLIKYSIISDEIIYGPRLRNVGFLAWKMGESEVMVRDERRAVSRIAFGSSLQHHIGQQTVWRSVIDALPDVWIWNGDFVYMDMEDGRCEALNDEEASTTPECTCLPSYNNQRPFCLSGDLRAAQRRVESQLSQTDYQAFLKYMCPASSQVPPEGASCLRPIIGAYNSHDFGFHMGNRLADPSPKNAIKHLYLDSLGEPLNSRRRSSVRGVEQRYVLNPEGSKHGDKEISIFLLDVRFYRDPLDCRLVKEECEESVQKWGTEAEAEWGEKGVMGKRKTQDSTKPALESDNFTEVAESSSRRRGKGQYSDLSRAMWCKEYLSTQCCSKDAFMFDKEGGVCSSVKGAPDQATQSELCDPSDTNFGSRVWSLTTEKSDSLVLEGGNGGVGATGDRLDTSLCEVLGQRQRKWLLSELYESRSRLNLIVTPSALFFNPDSCTPQKSQKSDAIVDSWDCYRPAQVSFVSGVARSGASCVLVLAGGDLKFADIKAVESGAGTKYHDLYKTGELPYTLYQVMSSGMTDSVTSEVRRRQEDSMNKSDLEDYLYPIENNDPYEMRVGGAGQFTAEPNFGLIDIDWKKEKALLQVRFAANNTVALSTEINLKSCTQRHMAV